MANKMKGISCCGDCIEYDWKKHRCKRGFDMENDPRDHFFDNCDLPDVQPVVHGRWDRETLDDFYKYKVTCSECGAEYIGNYDGYDEPSDFNFCPNCGAKMDLEG